MLNNVLYADLTGVFLVVGCTLFISLVTFTARDVGVSIRIRGMVQDGYVRDIDQSI